MANKHLLLRPCLSGSWGIIGGIGPVTPQKSNIDTKNDGLENVSPFQTWRHFGYLLVRFQGGSEDSLFSTVAGYDCLQPVLTRQPHCSLPNLPGSFGLALRCTLAKLRVPNPGPSRPRGTPKK